MVLLILIQVLQFYFIYKFRFVYIYLCVVIFAGKPGTTWQVIKPPHDAVKPACGLLVT